MTPPIVYNLFPRLVGPIPNWGQHARRAKAMGFNWLFVNPWHYPGFSGSLYAPKEYERLNPLFVPAGADERSLEPLRGFLREMDELGMPVMMDLVVNHTAKDSPLVHEHPEWYVRDERGDVVSPFARDPDDPSKVTIWGDLAEIDNAGTPDREGLWGFWAHLVRGAIDLGFAGFRCDAAYMVPADLWRHLVAEARSQRDDVLFFAETLGASVEQVLELSEAGLDFFFNSSKWWNFRDPWALEQHERFGAVAPSISFPETHDTTRLADDSGGDEAIQRQRYAFAAAFSAGVMMPVGYEFGFRKKTDVVHTVPADWEEPSFDISRFLRRVNILKSETGILQGEGRLTAPFGLGGEVLVLQRRGPSDDPTAYVIVNTDAGAAREADLGRLDVDPADYGLVRICRDDPVEEERWSKDGLPLDRAEVVYLLPRERRSDGHERGE